MTEKKVDYKEARRVGREEFEKRVAGSGLETYPCRSGYLVRAWGNEGRDIAAELDQAGLPYDRNLSGTFIISSWPFEKAAIGAAAAIPQAAEPFYPSAR